jgi:hypothetical protein
MVVHYDRGLENEKLIEVYPTALITRNTVKDDIVQSIITKGSPLKEEPKLLMMNWVLLCIAGLLATYFGEARQKTQIEGIDLFLQKNLLLKKLTKTDKIGKKEEEYVPLDSGDRNKYNIYCVTLGSSDDHDVASDFEEDVITAVFEATGKIGCLNTNICDHFRNNKYRYPSDKEKNNGKKILYKIYATIIGNFVQFESDGCIIVPNKIENQKGTDNYEKSMRESDL